jgi:hypothetical protein
LGGYTKFFFYQSKFIRLIDKKPNFDDSPSIVKKLLTEEFGGNCLVAYFFCMNPGDELADNFALLNIVEIVRDVVNFPIRNDENFQHLQRRIKKVE